MPHRPCLPKEVPRYSTLDLGAWILISIAESILGKPSQLIKRRLDEKSRPCGWSDEKSARNANLASHRWYLWNPARSHSMGASAVLMKASQTNPVRRFSVIKGLTFLAVGGTAEAVP
jgi:hypothetical protein